MKLLKDLAPVAPVYIARNILVFKRNVVEVVYLIFGVPKWSNSDTSMMLYKTMVIIQLGAYFLSLTQSHCPSQALLWFPRNSVNKTGTILFITIIPQRYSFPSSFPSQSCPKLICCFYSLYHIKSIASYWRKLPWPMERARGTVV